jgi:hypothetical protein
MIAEADSVVARFKFFSDRASEFSEGENLVMEINSLSIEEVYMFVKEFEDAIEDACILVNGTKVVYLSDYTYDT